MAEGQRTVCSGPGRPPEHPDFGPRVCGFDWVAPHPDPDISYRQALCRRHMLPVAPLFCTRCAFMQRTDPQGLCPTHDPRWPPPPQVAVVGGRGASAAFRNAYLGRTGRPLW